MIYIFEKKNFKLWLYNEYYILILIFISDLIQINIIRKKNLQIK